MRLPFLLLLLWAVACAAPSTNEADPSLAESASAPSFGSLTFNADIAPIVFSHCVPCHRPGEIAPFPLLSYADVRRRTEQIEIVTQSGYMPPWLPEPGYGEFEDARGLSATERAMIREWVRQGAPRGDEELPALPELSSGWQLGEPDLVVSLPQAYAVGAEIVDDIFRNFVLALDLTSLDGNDGRYVKAVEFRPHNRRLVHHASIKTDTTGRARLLDELDPELGYSGMVGAVAPGGHFLGWTPGRVAKELGEGMAWKLERGMDLVMEVHVLPTGKAESLQASVGLFLTDEPPTRFPASIHLGSTTLDIPAGSKTYGFVDEFTVPVDVDAVAIYPHCHYLGKEVKAFATLPDGRLEWLLWIRDWDFNWQDEYQYVRPVFLPAGTVVRLEIAYDNSAENVRNPSHPPKRVAWGPQSSDEMGDLWLKVIPRRQADLARLKKTILEKDLRLARVGYESAIERDPRDFEAQSLLGNLLVLQRDMRGAIPHLRAALEIDPDAWQVHLSLANATLQLGELDRSTHHFREVVRLRPSYTDAYTSLAVALSQAGRRQEARSIYQQALEIDPNNASAHSNLATLLTEMGEFEDAYDHYQRALEVDPDSAETHKNLANALAMQGRVQESIASLERVVELDPDDAEAHHYLGLGLASLGRFAAGSSRLQRAIELQPHNVAVLFDLGFVAAERGRHPEAVDYFRAALGRQASLDPEVHYSFALSLLEIGQPEEATLHLETALRIDPGHAGARRRLERVRGRPAP